MPFGGYPNFAACVADNGDKTDPEAFCAWLENQTTGKWPGEMTFGLPVVAISAFWQAFENYMAKDRSVEKAMTSATQAISELGWVKQKHGWTRKAENKVSTTSVYGVPIFAAGVHNGDKYTLDDLKGMIASFQKLKGRLDPPVKIGHTSDEFNKRLAIKMGVEPEMIKGEAGNGVMAFGWVESLRLSGNMLYADLSDVPQPVAELIEGKSYNKVSAEILFDFEDNGKTYPKVLSGLALLGGELPAVRETGLETAVVYTASVKPDSIIEFALDTEVVTYEQLEPTLSDIDAAIEKTMKGRAGVGVIRAMWKDVKGKVKNILATRQHSQELVETEPGVKPKKKEEVDEMNSEVLKFLGLSEGAKDEEVMAAVKKLQGEDLGPIKEALGLPPEATLADCVAKIKEMMGAMQGEGEQMRRFSDRVAQLEKDNKDLKRKERKAHYRALATDLRAISGTPDELAEELVKLEEAGGEDVSKVVLGRYQDQNKRLVAAGVLKAKGTPAEGDEDEHDFTKEVKTYMEEKRVEEPEATAALRKAKPVLWRDYMKKRRIVTRTVEETNQ